MSGAAYVVFDGDNDKWAYAYMNGWKANKNINFEYQNAHDLDAMTGRAQDENYVKSNLRRRMSRSTAVVVLVGEQTKYLYKYVRWELELALEMGLPIIVANLNKNNGQDNELCPAIVRDKACVVHIPYTLEALKHAMSNFPAFYRGLTKEQKAMKAAYSYRMYDK
ncbi:TIR domain-containing protein [Microvirga pudoricolor]|uniref:TIR domain-containing protein n=1 Tax=Microvirga pudoricolor TaxID=2778729 RepID=UPI00194DFC49|nr:TIR domain-containing protein [Microvirga pudoricolor]MBM6596343.1 TIR domain-containing protein [Microvirga pudoricolor]